MTVMMLYCPQCATTLQKRQISGRKRPSCPSCGYVYYEDPKVAVGVVAEKDGLILLVQRNHEPKIGLWSFPSGFVNAHESVEDAAIREVKEETGVDIRLDRLIGVYSQANERTIFIAYAGSIIKGEPTPGEEAMAVQYFHPSGLPKPAFPHDPKIISAWEQYRRIKRD